MKCSCPSLAYSGGPHHRKRNTSSGSGIKDRISQKDHELRVILAQGNLYPVGSHHFLVFNLSFFLLDLGQACCYHAARSSDRPCRQAKCRQKLNTEQSHRCVLKSWCVTSPTRDCRTRSFRGKYTKYYTAADVKVFRQLPVCIIFSDHTIAVKSRHAIPTNQANATSPDSQR